MKKQTQSKTQIVPLGNRVLVRPFTKDEIEKKNSFGIILPEGDKKEKSEQGKVIAVGKGTYVDGKVVTPEVKEGDVVLFSKYGYDDVTVDGEELYILKEENILAVIK
jgi:chaperonin GroES